MFRDLFRASFRNLLRIFVCNFRVSFRVSFRVQIFPPRVATCCRLQEFELRVYGLGFRVSGVKSRV